MSAPRPGPQHPAALVHRDREPRSVERVDRADHLVVRPVAGRHGRDVHLDAYAVRTPRAGLRHRHLADDLAEPRADGRRQERRPAGERHHGPGRVDRPAAGGRHGAGRRGRVEQCGGHHEVLPARRPAVRLRLERASRGKMDTTTVLTSRLPWCWHHPMGREKPPCRCPRRAPPSAPCSPVTPTARPRGCAALGEPGDAGWFGPGSTIWSVHADAATLVGGVRALLVQAMHPTVLAGFDQHSDYREDPESRLQRTAAFVTVTTFGTTAQAEAACERVRRAHAPVRGRTPGGERVRRRRPRAARLGAPRAGRLARRRGRSGSAAPGSTSTTTSPTWRWSGSTSASAHVRTTAAGLAAAWDHYLPHLAVTDATTAAHAFLLDPPLPLHDPAALPGGRRGRSRVAAAGAAPSARRPARCCPNCPRGWSAGRRPGCSRRSSARARPRARAPPAHRTGSVPSGDPGRTVSVLAAGAGGRCSPGCTGGGDDRPTGPGPVTHPELAGAHVGRRPCPAYRPGCRTPTPAAAASSAPASRCRSTGPTRPARQLRCRSRWRPTRPRPAACCSRSTAARVRPAPAGPGARRAFGPEVVAAYRLVVLDQRGTGPGALRCPALQRTVRPASCRRRARYVACAPTLGDARGHYGTDETWPTSTGCARCSTCPAVAVRGELRHLRGTAVRRAAPGADGAGAGLGDPAGGLDTLRGDVVRATPRVLGLACRPRDCPGDPSADLAAEVARDGDGADLLAAGTRP